MNKDIILAGWISATNLLIYSFQKYPISIPADILSSIAVQFIGPLLFKKFSNNDQKYMKTILFKKIVPNKEKQMLPRIIYYSILFAIPFIVNSNIMYKITNIATGGLTMKSNGRITIFGRILHSLVTGGLYTYF